MPKSRNPWLTKGVRRYGRHQANSRHGRFRVVKAAAEKTTEGNVTKSFQNGERELVRPRPSRFYPADDTTKKLYSRKNKQAPKIRSSLVPGTVLVLLAGKFKGKRVVLLRRLSSGLLVVTGPFVVNGVPLKRVNPAYVIATTTTVDLTGFALDATVKDDFFKRPSEKDNGVTEERKALQKTVDEALLAKVDAVEGLRAYLSARFSLSKGQYPHQLKF